MANDDAAAAAAAEAERLAAEQAAAASVAREAAAAERRALQAEVARHEQALADARRRLAAAPAPVPEDDDGASSVATDDIAGDAVPALHTQALGILNIRALVPVTLDLDAPSFSKWRRLMLLALGKYALADHVLSDAIYPNNPHWVRMDLHVLSWLYGTITTDLFEIVTTATPSAHTAWVALE